MTRNLCPCALTILLLSGVSFGQVIERTPTQLVRNDPNWFAQGGFGRQALGLDDFDGDGFPDFAVSAPDYPQGSFVGRVYVYSGRTGAEIQTFDGTQAGSAFGLSLADVGDVNMDGFRDLAVGAYDFDTGAPGANQGRVQVFSGATGLPLWSVDGAGQWGRAMAALGVGPGPRTLVVTEPAWSSTSLAGAGRVVFVNASTGAILDWAPGTVGFGGLGVQLAAAPDLMGIYSSNGAGTVYAITAGSGSGSGTATLAYTPPPGASGSISMAMIGGATPGSSRLALGYQTADSNGFTNNGAVFVYPVGSLTSVLTLTGPASSAFFGQKVGRVHDADGDGIDEIAVLSSGPLASSPNPVRIYDQSGALIDEALRPGGSSSVLTSIRDITGDGRGEWISAIGTGSTTRFECAVFSLGLTVSSQVAAPGTTITFALDAGPAHAGAIYAQGYSSSGFAPGLAGPSPWPLIALNPDSLTDLMLSLAGSPFLPDPIGILGPGGTTSTTFFLPSGAVAALANIDIVTTFVVLVGAGNVTFGSNPITLAY